MDFLMAPLIVGIISWGIYGLFELFVRRKERLAIIEKIGEKMDASSFDGKLSLPSYGTPRISFSALKTGCLLMGIGLGLLTGFFVNISVAASNWQFDFIINKYQVMSSVYGASVLLFGGLGLIIAFIIETKMKKKEDKKI